MNKFEELKKHFTDQELEWKPQQVGFKGDKPWAKVLCYVSARAIQDRLDAVFGCLNWKDTYRFEANGVICTLSVFCEEKKEWIAKENGSQETDIEAFKGGISGAFKRVASSGFGIGRYLYDLDTFFADCTTEKKYDQGWKYAKSKEGKTFYWQAPKIAKNNSNTSKKLVKAPSDKDQRIFEDHKATIEGISEAKTMLEIGQKLIDQTPVSYRRELLELSEKKVKQLKMREHRKSGMPGPDEATKTFDPDNDDHQSSDIGASEVWGHENRA